MKISCLLNEVWYIGIQEAWKLALNQSFDQMKKVLLDLHEKTKIAEESDFNIKFKKKYQLKFIQAETYISQWEE